MNAMGNLTHRISLLLTVLAVVLGPLVLFGLAADPADKYPGLNLIPWPREVRVGEGRLGLTADSRIVAGQPALEPLAKVLSAEIALVTGLKLKVATGEGRAGDIVLRI